MSRKNTNIDIIKHHLPHFSNNEINNWQQAITTDSQLEGQDNGPSYSHSSEHLNKIVLLYHSIIFAPLEKDNEDTIIKRVHNRLDHFKSGNIISLWREGDNVHSMSPEEQGVKAAENGAPPAVAAQSIIDEGNISGVVKTILHDTPPALINSSNYHPIQQL
eukprot:3781068-Ditylum_brightwellii.AAC.1